MLWENSLLQKQRLDKVQSSYHLQNPASYHDAGLPNLIIISAPWPPLPLCLSSTQKPLLSPHLGSYRTISLELSWASHPFSSKVPWPALTPLISPASCLVSQAAVWSIWPQAHELPRVGSLADPALPSAPNSPSHFCRMRARKGRRKTARMPGL